MRHFVLFRTGFLVLSLGLSGIRMASAQAPSPTPSPLQVFAAEAPNAVAWVLAPLEQPIPPNIRQNLTFLKEDLADEAKSKPVGTVTAYQTAYRFCSVMVAALDERDMTLVHAGFRTAQINNVPLVTSQTLEARRNSSMSWPQYAREQNQRSALETQATNQANVSKERLKVDWAEHVVTLRKTFDEMYSQFRNALRATPALLLPTATTAGPVQTLPAPGAPPATPAPNSPLAVHLPPVSSPPASHPGGAATIGSAPRESTFDAVSTAALNGRQNVMLPTPTPATLTPEETQTIAGLTIKEVLLPDCSGFNWIRVDAIVGIRVDAIVDNEGPKGVIEKQLSVDIRMLCVDADGHVNISKFSKHFDIGGKGPQKITFGGSVPITTLKTRNDNVWIPKNVYFAFRLNEKVFQEVLWCNVGDQNWWLRDDLVRE